jgi:2-amino-4-hydroxy-6-hydroxymethyldihydropteridine diphosphokinase
LITAHINIGSNLGDRTALIDRAVRLLSLLGNVEATCPVESDPWGYDSANRYLNVGVNLSTDIPALALHGCLQRIERFIDPDGRHRHADGSYADRLIDIDLIAYGQELIQTPQLTVPHPRMQSREFVLLPMARLMPRWRHPLLKLTAAELLEKLQ